MAFLKLKKDNKNYVNLIGGQNSADVEAYAHKMATTAEWRTHAELALFCTVFKTTVYVYRGNVTMWDGNVCNSYSKSIYLFYNDIHFFTDIHWFCSL